MSVVKVYKGITDITTQVLKVYKGSVEIYTQALTDGMSVNQVTSGEQSTTDDEINK